jgi:hypothetical protein
VAPSSSYIQNLNYGCVCSCVHLFLENRYTSLHQTWHAYSLRPDFFFEKVKTPEKLSSCRVLVRVVPVAQKLCMIEQQCQDQSLFWRGDYREPTTLKNCPWFEPWWRFFCTFETKHDWTPGDKAKFFFKLITLVNMIFVTVNFLVFLTQFFTLNSNMFRFFSITHGF